MVRAGGMERVSTIPPEDTYRLLTPGCRRGQGRGTHLAPRGAHLQRVVVYTWRGVVQINLPFKTALALALAVLQSAT